MLPAWSVTHLALDIDQLRSLKKINKAAGHPEACDMTAHTGRIKFFAFPFENFDGVSMVRS